MTLSCFAIIQNDLTLCPDPCKAKNLLLVELAKEKY